MHELYFVIIINQELKIIDFLINFLKFLPFIAMTLCH